jgi:hypothetical protein
MLKDCFISRCLGCGTKPSHGVQKWILTAERLREEFGRTDTQEKIIYYPLCRACAIQANLNQMFRDEIEQFVIANLRRDCKGRSMVVMFSAAP